MSTERPGQGRGVVWWQGFVAGLIGYAGVAAFFGFANLVSGHSFFHTAALLGHTLLGTDPGPDVVAAAPVFAYNGLHLLLFLAFGVTAAWLVEEAERHPPFWYLVFFAFLFGFFFDVALVTLFTIPLAAEAVPWGTIVAANLTAGIGMAAYLGRRHPGLLEAVEREGDPGRPD